MDEELNELRQKYIDALRILGLIASTKENNEIRISLLDFIKFDPKGKQLETFSDMEKDEFVIRLK